MADLESIQKKIITFRDERDWSQFHDPKNLAEALSIEAGELLENFPWKTLVVPLISPQKELKNKKRIGRRLHLSHQSQWEILARLAGENGK